jgi:hypothetical protein
MKTIKRTCAFAKHEVRITKGEFHALGGWWDAGNEARLHYASVSEYAREAGKVAKDNTENTIRQYVGAIVKAMELGATMDEFKGIEHLRASVKGNGQRKVEDKKAVRSVRFTSARKEELASILRRAKVSDAEIASLFAFGTLGK